jgi:hypothetical protein
MLGSEVTGRTRRLLRNFPLRGLRQSEIQYLYLALPCDKNIRRLDVAVDDPVAMRGIQCFGDLEGEAEEFW